MKIIACDYHPSFPQIAMLDQNTGELSGRRWAHAGEAEAFYRGRQGPVRVGMEAIGNALWLERLLAELGHELWVGDAARIRASAVRPKKTDARDAAPLLPLMLQDRFPRIGVPSPAERDLRQLLLHRHKLVQMRTPVKNQLQHLALHQGVRRQHRLWSRAGLQFLEQLRLPSWTARRRQDLRALRQELERSVAELDQAVEAQALARPEARRLMSQPGVGPVVALAVVLRLGPVEVRQASSQLLRSDSPRVLQGWTAATGGDQQARQSVRARPAGPGRARGGATRFRTAPAVPEAGATEEPGGGPGGPRPAVGGAVVRDPAPRGAGLSSNGLYAGPPESFPGRSTRADALPCLPT